MEQKRVTFEVAKALKEAGYPQDIWKCSWFYSEDGELLNISNTGYYEIPAPTYLDVWLWLWRENRIPLELFYYNRDNEWYVLYDNYHEMPLKNDPEEAIEAAIKYIVDNGLLK